MIIITKYGCKYSDNKKKCRICTKETVKCPKCNCAKLNMLGWRERKIINADGEEITLILHNQIEHFLSAKSVDGLSAKTLKEYRYQLLKFAGHADHNPNRVKTDHLRGYLSYLGQEQHLKPSSIVTTINILKSFFGWMQTEEIIFKNPMNKIKPLNLDKKNLRHNLSMEEVELIRNCCVGDREKAMFELFYSSGCRLTELTKINIPDINFHERSINVIGKGSKERTIYFSVKAKLCILQYIKDRKENGGALFIRNKKPYTRLGQRSIQLEIKRVSERASVQTKVFPHILRHTFATHALNSGMDIGIIQKLMGHDNPNTTQIYCKISGGIVKTGYDRLLILYPQIDYCSW